MAKKKGEYSGNQGWSMEEIRQTVGGEWYHPLQGDVLAQRFAIVPGAVSASEPTMFVAINTPTWLKGSGNTGLYAAEWTDTHALVPRLKDKVAGYILQKPSKDLPASIPQLVVEDSYVCISKLAAAARDAYTGKIIAVTGTVGKSSTKGMLDHLLRDDFSLTVTVGNHNTRTGVLLTLAALKKQPEFCILEVAISALWMHQGGICTWVKPYIGIITEIGVSHANVTRTPRDTAKHKAKICEGIQPGGYAVLNAGMDDLKFIVKEVKRYGAQPILYGDGQNADARLLSRETTREGSLIHANILGEEVQYSLAAFGRGMALNSLAALTAAKLSGLDIQKLAPRFAMLPRRKSVFEVIEVDTGTGTVTLIDDSYNSEILSTAAAFETAKELNRHAGRQIAVLGQIVNLHDLGPSMYQSLAQPFLENNFSKAFGQGQDLVHLLAALPPSHVGGEFHSAASLVEGVLDFVQDGDVILIKGDRRDTDFDDCRKLLIHGLRHRNTAGTQQKTGTGASLYNLADGLLLEKTGDDGAYVRDEGLGGVLLIYYALRMLSEQVITLAATVTVRHVPGDAQRFRTALGLARGDTATVSQLLSACILTGAPDAALVLAEHMESILGADITKLLQSTASNIGLSADAVHNITGRTRTSVYQQYALDDVKKVAGLLFSLPAAALEPLRVTGMSWGKKHLRNSGMMHETKEALYSLYFGHGTYNAAVLAKKSGKLVAACVCDARSDFQRDYLSAGLVCEPQDIPVSTVGVPLSVTARTNVITLCGDTYFGEWYTARRLKAGEKDALSTHGYTYSFETVAHFLNESDCNILNFEAVLTKEKKSPVEGRRKFILRGDVEESIKELKRRNIHAVSLANNHTMDYGIKGLYDTIHAFNTAGIRVFGCGQNAAEAETPLELSLNGRTLALFSAYWHIRLRHLDGYYAIGSRAGSAVIGEPFYQNIANYRQTHPDATIIAFTHWGEDFSYLVERLRPMADRIMRSGADMIIGSGPHTLAPIEFMYGKPVLFSIGNFVFNSNGLDFKNKKVPPYGLVPRLTVQENSMALKLYPIYTYNPETFWQPYPVTLKQFDEVATFLGTMHGRITKNSDDLGNHFDIAIQPAQ